MNGQEIRPGRWYYGLAAVVFISGWVLFGLFLYRNLSGISSKLQQVVVPGKTQLSLDRPGSYTIYYEQESVVGSKVYSTSRSLSGLECTVTAKATGEEVALSRAAVSSRYSVGGRSGYSVFDFKIDRPGNLRPIRPVCRRSRGPGSGAGGGAGLHHRNPHHGFRWLGDCLRLDGLGRGDCSVHGSQASQGHEVGPGPLRHLKPAAVVRSAPCLRGCTRVPFSRKE
jgi:hypothetical protein